MDAWDRSLFAMDPSELLAEEAVRAMMRVLEEAAISEPVRGAVREAVRALRSEKF